MRLAKLHRLATGLMLLLAIGLAGLAVASYRASLRTNWRALDKAKFYGCRNQCWVDNGTFHITWHVLQEGSFVEIWGLSGQQIPNPFGPGEWSVDYWVFRHCSEAVQWYLYVPGSRPPYYCVYERRVIVPLWRVVVLLSIWPAVVGVHAICRYRRRPGPGHCRTCGYCLTGNLGGVCPECGQAISKIEIPPAGL